MIKIAYFYSITRLLIICLISWLFIGILGAKEVDFEDHASVSFYAVHIDTGEVLLEKNSDLSLMPASCMKIVTTAAALHLLGPDRRFETKLEYDGFIDHAKTLRGNVYIRGGGDPCLGSNRLSGTLDWKEQIEAWVAAIKKLGIRKIEGKIIGDASKWEKALAVPSWSWEDLGNHYGAGACALSFHENRYSLLFKPGREVGDHAVIIRTDPPLSLVFQNEVMTGPKESGDRACIYGSEFSSLRYIRGTIPCGVNEFTIFGAIPSPAESCSHLLAMELERQGISIQNQDVCESQRALIHTTYSPSLKEIVYWTNQKSINLYAEHLLKKIGEIVNHEGSTEAGVQAVKAFLKSQNLDLEGLNIVDGSGLSRKNLMTTKQLVTILLKMKKSTFYPYFFESLPQFSDNASIRAKSGSMSLVRGYAGYAGDIAFAILVNQFTNAEWMDETIHSFFSNLK